MYFKVNVTGCGERRGLCEVRYDLYLDPDDHGYSEHYVQVPMIPEGGYMGKMDNMGVPVDQVDYDKWLAALPRVWQNNPFCCHFCQFESTVTDEEILYVGELALDMAFNNWKTGDLHKNKNQPVSLIDLTVYKHIAKPIVESEKEIKQKNIHIKFDGDMTALLVDKTFADMSGKEAITEYAKAAIDKIKSSEQRAELVKSTDFTSLECSNIYKVR